MYDHELDCSSGTEGCDEDLESEFIEFSVNYTSSINPKSFTTKSIYPNFTVSAVKSKEGYEFYLNKFLSFENGDVQTRITELGHFNGT